MNLEERMNKTERQMIMSGIFAMGFHYAYRNPETGKILFYEKDPEIKGNDIVWEEEGKDFYEKADHVFFERDFNEDNICSLGVNLLRSVLDFSDKQKEE